MNKSGLWRGIVAERPSVNNSNQRISLTMALGGSKSPRTFRNLWVTIRVRAIGSSRSDCSRTCDLIPCRASSAAVNRPAAEPPTTATGVALLLPLAGVSGCVDNERPVPRLRYQTQAYVEQ